MLLVLDNFEHLLGAADDVATLLAECPSLKILVTSRAPLHVSWEQVVQVAPLTALPAIELFVDRARALKPDFKLTDESAAAVADICDRLDGLPLAIELAAARAAVLSPTLIRARLDRGLDWLGHARADAPERHQTLADAIAWSYALLSPPEQRVFRHLAVFGGCAPDAAAAVAQADEPPERVLRMLAALAEQSLLVQDPSAPPDEPRFRMLATIREYAREQLEQNGEHAAARQRHALFFLELAERADAGLAGPAQATWLARLAREHDNLVAALAFTHAHAPEQELRLGAALAGFWYARAETTDLGRQWLERALAWSAVQDGDSALRGQILASAARLALLRGDTDTAVQAAESSVAIWRQLDAPRWLAEMLALVAVARRRGAERSRAEAAARESVAVGRQSDSPAALVSGLLASAELDISAGNYLPAGANLREALSMASEHGLLWQAALALEGLAAVVGALGQPERALRLGGGAARLREELRLALGPAESVLLTRRLGPAQAALTAEQQAAAWQEGGQLPLKALVDEGLKADVAEDTPATRADVPADVAGLTRRERQVVGLVALGLQNQEIAQRLGIALHTVEVHVGRALSKLHMRSRAQLAVWAVERGLVESGA
jgi:non-specific serine/threonine protein kinase